MNTSASTDTAPRTSTITEARPVASIAPTPRFCSWLYLVCFQASLVVGTLLLATAPGQQRTAAAVYAGSVSGWLGANALYRLGDWRARTRRLLRNVTRATIALLVAGSATSLILASSPQTEPVSTALLLGAVLLYLVGAGCLRRRRPAPRPRAFGDRELVGHWLVCAAAAVQYVGLSLLIL